MVRHRTIVARAAIEGRGRNRRSFLFGASALGVIAVAGRAAADTVTYTYDARGRLLTATYSDGTTFTYTYDLAGNRTQVVAGDMTPAAVDWANISGSSGATNSAQTISSINQAITLTITYTGSGDIQYSKNGGTYTSISSGGTISVVVSDTLAFKANVSSGSASGTVTVTNSSGGSTTLDTFTYSVTASTDVTPNAVNWTNITAFDPTPPYSMIGNTSIVTITGINTTITLRIEDDNSYGSAATLKYSKNGGSLVTLTSGAKTISISNNDTLKFNGSSTSNADGNLSVYNDTDGGALLDTIHYSLTNS